MEERGRFCKNILIPEEFKKEWNSNLDCWLDYTLALSNTNLNKSTTDFLKKGFPNELGWRFRFNNSLNSIEDLYKNEAVFDSEIAKLLILGYDDEGNPICIDINSNDRIVLLDIFTDYDVFYESKSLIEMGDVLNKNIVEFANCLLVVKDYYNLVDNNDAFRDQKKELMKSFKNINPNIFKESEFWHFNIIEGGML